MNSEEDSSLKQSDPNFTSASPVYKSSSLEKEVRIWVNSYKLKPKDFEEKNSTFVNKLNQFTKKLRDKNSPVKRFDFNKKSIYLYLEEIFS